MSLIYSAYGDVFDSVQGKNVESADKNANGALCKFQDDARPISLVQQAAEQNATPTTNLVQQAIEQNPRTMAGLILNPGVRISEPPTSLVTQAAEQNKDTVIRNVESILIGNFMHFDRADGRPTNYVEQAAEQNAGSLVREAQAQNATDTVIRNVEGILSGGFINFDKANGQTTNYVREAKEQNDKPREGLHKWFSEDLETNLIDNASEILTRGTASKMLATKPEEGAPLILGPVGYLQGLDPKDFWHSQNDKTDLAKYVKQNVTAVKFEAEGVNKAITALDERINQNLKDVRSGQKLDANQTDRMRQMAENTAMMKLAVAESQRSTDPKAAKDLVSGKGNSVTELIRVAEAHGANKDNIQQLAKMVEQFNKRD